MDRAGVKQSSEPSHEELCDLVRDALQLADDLEHDMAAIHLQSALDALGSNGSASGTIER